MVFHKAVNTKRAIRFFEHLIALYFYNNSNNIAVLLPRGLQSGEKPVYGF